MKNKILISLLVVSFFNYIGCYSYYTISNEEIKEGKLEPNESIKLVLKDGSEFECEPLSDYVDNNLFYFRVDTAGSYLMGRGDLSNMSTGVTSNFNGVIQENMIDSSRIVIINSLERYSVWTKNNEWLLFNDGYYVIITPEQGTGYFLWTSNEEVRKVSFNEIKEIQESDINWYVGGLFIALSVAAITAIVFLLIYQKMRECSNNLNTLRCEMKKYISAVLINALLIQLAGCYSWETVQTPKQNSTIKITTKDSTEFEMQAWSWNETDKYFVYFPDENRRTERDSIVREIKLDKNDIIAIQEKKFNDGIVIGILVGGIVLALFIAILVGFQNWHPSPN